MLSGCSGLDRRLRFQCLPPCSSSHGTELGYGITLVAVAELTAVSVLPSSTNFLTVTTTAIIVLKGCLDASVP